MVWYIEEFPDLILTVGYAYLLYRIKATDDSYFSTPFFQFFFTTGVGGIVSVISHILATRVVYYPQHGFLYTFVWIVNHVGSLGSTLGKAIIIMHRYLVFSSDDISEDRLSRTACRRLIGMQFFLPLVTSVPLLFFGYTYQDIDGKRTIFNLSDDGFLTMKAINGSVYAVYSVFSVVLVVLTGRALLRLSTLVQGTTRKAIIGQQRNMFIIVIGCSLSHLVKAIHQFAWALTGQLKMTELFNIITPFYSYANGLATYTTPIFLVIFSKRVRCLLIFARIEPISPITTIAANA